METFPSAPDGPLVFAGSSPADVEHARIFWTSATLPPPLESSLGPATLRREGNLPLRGACPIRGHGPIEEPFLSFDKDFRVYNEVKWHKILIHFSEIIVVDISFQAKKREDILALLRKQREERIAVSFSSDYVLDASQGLCILTRWTALQGP
uniref:Cilia- and flagella-associated protein HOATZ n=1 Tax=Anser brachyrhynchus TaxID=132585 RepID=A0A8B9BI89_9AVES